MSRFVNLFPTLIYQYKLLAASRQLKELNRNLLRECKIIRQEDNEGQIWSSDHYINGYTSYGSMSELHRFSPYFAELEECLASHATRFAKSLFWDLKGRKLSMTSCWVNMMSADTSHSSHLHPLSVLSGTYYLQLPKNSSPLKFEDPRLPMMMAAPPRRPDAPRRLQPFVTMLPQVGDLILFESWLKHEVPMSKAKGERISISFNYDWD